MPKFYRKSEERLATVQRARKTRHARAIHAKIANRRKDFLHKASAKLAEEYGFIFVGDVSPSKVAHVNAAKNILRCGLTALGLKAGVSQPRGQGSFSIPRPAIPLGLEEGRRPHATAAQSQLPRQHLPDKRMDLRRLRNGPRPGPRSSHLGARRLRQRKPGSPRAHNGCAARGP